MTIVLLLMAAMKATAQNSIDKLVEKISTMGSVTFTSVVDRNPSTKEVEKVVKILKITGNPDQFERAFREEAQTGILIETYTDDDKTLALTIERPKDKRVYVMTYNKKGRQEVRVTIVIKFK